MLEDLEYFFLHLLIFILPSFFSPHYQYSFYCFEHQIGYHYWVCNLLSLILAIFYLGKTKFIAVAARGGMETLRPALQRVYMTRASAYRDALKSFIQGYQEGVQQVMEKKGDSKSEQEGNAPKNSHWHYVGSNIYVSSFLVRKIITQLVELC